MQPSLPNRSASEIDHLFGDKGQASDSSTLFCCRFEGLPVTHCPYCDRELNKEDIQYDGVPTDTSAKAHVCGYCGAVLGITNVNI